jgi:hypothetical protein
MSREGRADQAGGLEGTTRSSTTYGPRSLQDELVGLMSAASQRVWVKVPWWKHRDTPGPALIFQELVAAAGRGCDVRVLLRPEASNSATLAALNKARVAVQALRYLHEKELLADTELLVHSANFTRPELHRNQNAGYRITRPQDIEAAEAAFELFWQAAAGTVAVGEEQWLPASTLLPAELFPFFADTPRLNPMQAMALPVVLATGGHVVLGGQNWRRQDAGRGGGGVAGDPGGRSQGRLADPRSLAGWRAERQVPGLADPWGAGSQTHRRGTDRHPRVAPRAAVGGHHREVRVGLPQDLGPSPD